MRFIVTGHPRCGTGYMARLLTAFGINVQHEHVGWDGMSAWSWAVCDPGSPWCDNRPRQPKDRTPDSTLIHVIRNPDRALWSIAYAYNCVKTDEIIARYCPQFAEWSPLDNAALSFYSWNAIVRAQAPDLTVKVEEAPSYLSHFLGRPLPDSLPPTDYNSKKKKSPPTHYGEPVLHHLRPETRALISRWASDHMYELRNAKAA